MENKNKLDGWMYYQNAAIPTSPPHLSVNLSPISNRDIWNHHLLGGRAMFAIYNENWDCSTPTDYWYCIKDTFFDLSSLKKKRRYEINKGRKNFEIKKIIPDNIVEQLFRCTLEAYSGWPVKYRPKIDKKIFKQQLQDWSDSDFFIAIDRDSGSVEGYAVLHDEISYVNFSVLRTNPSSEKKGINAAIVSEILRYYNNRFDGKFYISDGQRSIRHETNFQDYLEKYFGFRKAYCTLKIKYRPFFGLIIWGLYPFRNLINFNSKLGSKILGVLKLEAIHRSCKGRSK